MGALMEGRATRVLMMVSLVCAFLTSGCTSEAPSTGSDAETPVQAVAAPGEATRAALPAQDTVAAPPDAARPVADAETAPRSAADGPRTMVIETAPLAIDQIYHSMAGPFDRQPVDFSVLDWVTGYRTEVVDATTRARIGDEFFCHSQLQMVNGTRLMVTATGSEEIRFPEGFGMPLSQVIGAVGPEQRSLTLLGMVLNNHIPDIDRSARVRATVEYWRNIDDGRPRKKLYKTGLTMEVEDLEVYHPPAGQPVNDDVSTHCVLVGEAPAHWMVPPGRQVTRKRYRNFLAIDGTVHYAVVHVHNHARYLRLIDVTTDTVLWQTDVEYEPERVQISKIPVYDSAEGFPIFKSHEYEIEALYENTTDHAVDAMAQIDLYWHPKGNVNISYPIGPQSQ